MTNPPGFPSVDHMITSSVKVPIVSFTTQTVQTRQSRGLLFEKEVAKQFCYVTNTITSSFFLIKVTVREISKVASKMTPPLFSFYLDPLQSNKGKKKAQKKSLKTRNSPVWNTLRFA